MQNSNVLKQLYVSFGVPLSSPPHRLVEEPSLIALTVTFVLSLLSAVICVKGNSTLTCVSYDTTDNLSVSFTIKEREKRRN